MVSFMGLSDLKERILSSRNGTNTPTEDAFDDPFEGITGGRPTTYEEPTSEQLVFSDGNAANGVLTAVPRKRTKRDATDEERKARLMVWGMLSSLPVAALAILISFAAIATGGGGGGGNAAANQATADADTTLFDGYAQLVAADYLAGRDSVLPSALGQLPLTQSRSGDTSIGESGPTPIAYDTLVHLRADVVLMGKSEQRVEVHYFAVRTGQSVLELAVPIADNNGPTLAGTPSLGPLTVGDASDTPLLNWASVYPRATLEPRDIAQIQRWAEAYAANDGDSLYTLTGDPDPHRYAGLGGFKVAGPVRILSQATFRPDKNTDGVLVAVQVSMAAQNDPSIRFVTTYDVLLSEIDRAQPSVSAWTAHGSGPTLRPFINALAAEETD